ncbi:hypothetical protein C8J57DRAFT_1530769 [Mycena rebaudengoi]|nr:hypothetical protein C8J57DRAFT_1530769 [Mycena rebaudengoi]
MHFQFKNVFVVSLVHLRLGILNRQSIQLAALMNIGAFAVSISERTAQIVPVSATGSIGAIQDRMTADSRFYFQASNNSITELAVSGPFNSPHTNNAPGFTLVPANEVLMGTAIAAILINGDIHVYFFSPAKVLSEYVWVSFQGWNGGPSCTICVTRSGFAAASTGLLYAIVNSAGQIKVGFVSAGVPGTIVEAGIKPGGSWALSSL